MAQPIEPRTTLWGPLPASEKPARALLRWPVSCPCDSCQRVLALIRAGNAGALHPFWMRGQVDVPPDSCVPVPYAGLSRYCDGTPPEVSMRPRRAPSKRAAAASGPLFEHEDRLAAFNRREIDLEHRDVNRQGWEQWRAGKPVLWVHGRPYPDPSYGGHDG